MDERKPLLNPVNLKSRYLPTKEINADPSSDGTINTSHKVHVQTKVYWYRWYILLLYSAVAALANITWNTWGPIESTSKHVYGWSTGTISLLADWGAATYLIAVFPIAWLLDVKGLRVSMLVCGFFLTVGSGLRCITHKSSIATPLIHIGQFIMGLGGPVAQSAATVLSSTWFPPKQRTTATAVASLTSYIGTALSFIIGPQLVEDVEKYRTAKDQPVPHNVTVKVTQEIMNLMYLEFGISGFLFLLLLISFPAKPPLPPSATAAIERVDYKDGLKRLWKNPQFQLIAFLYGITTGVYSAWCSDLAVNLNVFKVTDDTASWIGFWAVIAGSVTGILLSLIADTITGIMKPILMILFIIATGGFTVFTLTCVRIIEPSLTIFYVMSVIGGLCINGAIPLFFELAVESSYPVAEGINTGFMTFSNNVYCTIFLTIPLIPKVGTKWMNWVLVGSCAVCIPMLLLFKERHRRLEVDVKAEEEGGTTAEVSILSYVQT